jgi:hypothetical protein
MKNCLKKIISMNSYRKHKIYNSVNLNSNERNFLVMVRFKLIHVTLE